MSGARATISIVRHRIDRAYGLEWIVRFTIVAAITALFAPLYAASLQRIVLACAVLPLASASEGSNAAKLRSISFFAMPLYGRELARAHAVAPCLGALAAPLGFAAGLALRHAPASAQLLGVTLLANAAGALVNLSAVFRDGPRAWLYHALTVAAGLAIAAPLALGTPHPVAGAGLVAVAIGFIALRAFGETLARYDPLP